MGRIGSSGSLRDDYDDVSDPIARQWLKRARDFGRARDSFCEVRAGTSAWEAWEAYFRRLGWRPVTFDRRFVGQTTARSWTAPCRDPGDLDRWVA